MGLKVCKFGESSVADAIQLAKIKDIVESDPMRKYIVVSAPGKRYEEDQKITDLLYLCRTHIEQKVPYEQIFQVVCDRYMSLARNLNVELDLSLYFDEIRERLENNASADYIASRGEFLSALIIADFLGMDFVDAETLIHFDKHGRLLKEETERDIHDELIKHENAVVPGFYGTFPDGNIKTFPRGGSDITGALVAKAMEAEVYERWGDIGGYLMADPALVTNPHQIDSMTYMELRELAYMGAPVLSDDAIYPARSAGIPIHIRSVRELENNGTVITSAVSRKAGGGLTTDPASPMEAEHLLTGIAGSNDFTVVGIYKGMMAAERGLLRKVLSVFEDYDVNVEHVPSSIDNVSIVVKSDAVEGCLEDITEDIERKLHPEEIIVERIALIAVVSNAFAGRPGCAARLLTAIAKAGVNLKMIDQGASEINIILGVAKEDFETAVKAIYDEFEGGID